MKRIILILFIALMMPAAAAADDASDSSANLDFVQSSSNILLPDSPWYWTIRVREFVQLNVLTFGQESKMQIMEKIAERRLLEAQVAAEKDKSELVSGIIARYNETVEAEKRIAERDESGKLKQELVQNFAGDKDKIDAVKEKLPKVDQVNVSKTASKAKDLIKNMSWEGVRDEDKQKFIEDLETKYNVVEWTPGMNQLGVPATSSGVSTGSGSSATGAASGASNAPATQSAPAAPTVQSVPSSSSSSPVVTNPSNEGKVYQITPKEETPVNTAPVENPLNNGQVQEVTPAPPVINTAPVENPLNGGQVQVLTP